MLLTKISKHDTLHLGLNNIILQFLFSFIRYELQQTKHYWIFDLVGLPRDGENWFWSAEISEAKVREREESTQTKAGLERAGFCLVWFLVGSS